MRICAKITSQFTDNIFFGKNLDIIYQYVIIIVSKLLKGVYLSLEANEKDVSLLLRRIKDDDGQAIRQLLDIYEPLVQSNVANYSSLLEEDDIRQICAIGLLEAAQSYSEDKAKGSVTFGLYAKICIRNRLMSELRRLGPVSQAVESELCTDETEISPEDKLIRKEEFYITLDEARRRLTSYENRVLSLYLTGRSYAQIAAILGKPKKSVDNALKRVREKFRGLF